MPRMVVTVVPPRSVGLLATGSVQVAPAVAFLHHRFEVLAPDSGVLDRIADDRPGKAGGNVVRLEPPIAEMGRQRQALVDYGDRLGRREGRRGDLELVLAVLGLARTQLAKDRDDPANLLEVRRFGRQVEGAAHLTDSLLH